MRLRQKQSGSQASNSKTQLKEQKLLESLDSDEQVMIENSSEVSENNNQINSTEKISNEERSKSERTMNVAPASIPTTQQYTNVRPTDVCTIEITSPRPNAVESKQSEEISQVPTMKRRICIEPIDSTVPKLIDVKSTNILNICTDPTNPTEISSNIKSKNTESKVHDKQKSLIEVLSDSSDVSDLSDIEQICIPDKLLSNEMLITPSVNVSIVSDKQTECLTGKSDNTEVNEKCEDIVCVTSKIEIQSSHALRSGAITFYCENLDELKDDEEESNIGSNVYSDSSMDEI